MSLAIRLRLALYLAFCIPSLLVGCGEDTPEPRPVDGGGGGRKMEFINIAVVAPFSGSASAYGEMVRLATQLMIDEVNAVGGVNGRLLVARYEDDGRSETKAAEIARTLAADESISLVIGHFNSACTNTAKKIYNDAGLVAFTSGSTSADVCRGFDWIFRNVFHDDYQGIFLAHYAKKILRARRVAIFYENDDYGKGLMEAFTEEARRLGMQAPEPIPYDDETRSFRILAKRIEDRNADLIFLSGLYSEAANITVALRKDLGIRTPILGGDGVMNDTFIRLAEESAEGVYATSPFFLAAAMENPATAAFQRKFREKNGKDPDTWAALTYDAVGMAIEAIRKVGPDRRKIRDWLAAITTPDKAFEGVTGPTYFDSEGDCYSKGAHVAVVRDGKFVPAERQLKLTE